MRQSFSRSAIYIVIGLGLFVFAVSQWKRTTAPDTAIDVAHSFESDIATSENTNSTPVTTQSLAADNGQPMLQVADPVADVDANRLPPIAETMVDPSPGIQATLELADTDEEVDFASLPQQDAYDGEDFQMSDSMIDSAPELGSTSELDSTSEMDSTPEMDSDVDFDSFDSADLQDQDFQELMTDARPVATITDVVTMDSESEPEKQTAATGEFETAWDKRKSSTIGQARNGWQQNPFLNEQASNVKPLNQSKTAAVESPLSEELIKSQFEDSVDQFSTVSNIEPDAELAANLSLPTVDHETMQSVIASEDYHEANSPSVKLGLSDADAQKAVHNIEYGKSLSRRGAAFAARQEFYSSLRILAQSHDKQVGGVQYTQSLRNGIIALKEAEDFIVADTESQIGLKVANVIETHTTKIISPQSASGMTAIEAMQRYFAFASHQLARAGGQNVVAAECFYCLGKLHSVQAKQGSSASNLDVAKSLVFHQAAISADPSNYRSLNELGVLYANSGRFEESKEMLKSSLRNHQLPQAWENLAVVHQRLGETQMAELANREFELASAQQSHSTIQWTNVNEFNKNAPLLQRTATESNNVVPASANSNDSSSLKSLGTRILNSIR